MDTFANNKCRKKSRDSRPKRLQLSEPDEETKTSFVTLVSSDGDEFEADGEILSKRSSYFRAMFGRSFRESSSSRADFPTVNSRTLGTVLQHCYDELSTLLDVIRAARSLDIPRLVNASCASLGGKIAVENYETIWSFNRQFPNTVLESCLTARFGELYAKFLDEDRFLTFEAAFVKFLLEKLRPHYNQMSLLNAMLSWVENDPETRTEYFAELMSSIDTYRLPLGYIENLANDDELFRKHFETSRAETVADKTEFRMPTGTGLIAESVLLLAFTATTYEDRATVQWFDFSGKRGPIQTLPFAFVYLCVPYRDKLYIAGVNLTPSRVHEVSCIHYDLWSNTWSNMDYSPRFLRYICAARIVEDKLYACDRLLQFYDFRGTDPWKLVSANFKVTDAIIQHNGFVMCMKNSGDEHSPTFHKINGTRIEEDPALTLPECFKRVHIVQYKGKLWGFNDRRGITCTYVDGDQAEISKSDMCSPGGCSFTSFSTSNRHPLVGRQDASCIWSLWDFEMDVKLGEVEKPFVGHEYFSFGLYCIDATL